MLSAADDSIKICNYGTVRITPTGHKSRFWDMGEFRVLAKDVGKFVVSIYNTKIAVCGL